MADINSLVMLNDGTLTANTTMMQCAPICGTLDHELAKMALLTGLVLGAIIVLTMNYIGRWYRGWREGDKA